MRLKSHHYANTVYFFFEMFVLITLNQIEIKNILATSCPLNISAYSENQPISDSTKQTLSKTSFLKQNLAYLADYG